MTREEYIEITINRIEELYKELSEFFRIEEIRDDKVVVKVEGYTVDIEENPMIRREVFLEKIDDYALQAAIEGLKDRWKRLIELSEKLDREHAVYEYLTQDNNFD